MDDIDEGAFDMTPNLLLEEGVFAVDVYLATGGGVNEDVEDVEGTEETGTDGVGC